MSGDIVLHKDPGQQGQSLGIVDSVIGEEINIGVFADGSETTFNDTVSSFTANEGTWQFFTDSGLAGNTGVLEAGTFGDFLENDDAITSIRRIA